jgi:hypothetical protein
MTSPAVAPVYTAPPTACTLPEILASEFASARRELLRAKANRRVRDDQPNRDAVDRAFARLDAILDTHLESR